MRKLMSRFGSLFVAVATVSGLVLPHYALAAIHSAGTNVSNNGTVYMITDNGQRRPYTSAGAFLSYGFNSWATVAQATPEDLAAPEGSFIPPRDGKIVCSDRGSDKGTCYLITNAKRAAFVSAQVFTDLGFSFSKALYGDVSFLGADSNISASGEQHRAGVLINKNGTVYLVSSTGLLGIPSVDVLTTWGYSFADVVNANGSDSSLSQISVITGRQGAQLSPNQSGASDSSLIQSYIDTYPDLPTATISAPQDGAAVIDLSHTIDTISGSFTNVYPYLSSQSLAFINAVPAYKEYMDEASTFVPYLKATNSNIQVFQGGANALFTEFQKQDYSGYAKTNYFVAIKENGVWKWDLLGTYKYQEKVSSQRNPSDSYVSGGGSSDISVVSIEYPTPPKLNEKYTYALVEVTNKGNTTIEKFHLVCRFNNVVVVDEDELVTLAPNQTVYMGAPIDYYWSLNGVTKVPGSYSTAADVGLGGTMDDNINNNSVNIVTSIYN